MRPMPKLSAVAGKTFFLKCPVAGFPIDSIIIEKGKYWGRMSDVNVFSYAEGRL